MKLGDRWDGPYEIRKKVVEVICQLAVPNHRGGCMMAHVKRLKAWNVPDAFILRMVVADEVEAEGKVESDWKSLLESHQCTDIEQLQVHYADLLNGSLGKGMNFEHEVNTEAHDPIWTPPHRIAPAWREPLKVEVMSWVEMGIIRPSNSPWSSPVVPVRKPDGSFRLCVDYQNLNKLTTPDPYPIPRIDDLIDELNDARYLTKIDLNKEF